MLRSKAVGISILGNVEEVIALQQRRRGSQRIHPFVNSDRKPEPSYYPALAAFDIKVDRKSKFPVLLSAMATVYRTIANARLRSELTKGCIPTYVEMNSPEAN